MYSLKDKVVVITGASSGIGKALADIAYNKGAKVAACARNLEKLNDSFSSYESSRLLTSSVDVSSESDCEAFINSIVDKWGSVDVLINNAGISMRALFEDTKIEVIKELMNINFFGAVHCTKYALPHIIKAKGAIIGVSSIAGYRGLPARTGYSASKFALQGFLEALRTELLYTGVNVMWVSPGFTASNIRNTARSHDGSAQGETPLDEKKLMSAEECADIIISAIENKKRSKIMTLLGKMTVWVNYIMPSFVDKQSFKRFSEEPDSPLKKYNPN